MFIGVFLGCVIGQILLAVFGVQSLHDSFVGGFWQSSAILACWLIMRAPDVLWASRKSDGESTSSTTRTVV